jgi:hypothetical protein
MSKLFVVPRAGASTSRVQGIELRKDQRPGACYPPSDAMTLLMYKLLTLISQLILYQADVLDIFRLTVAAV